MITNTVCRKCRREGTKLFLKGERCSSPKCFIERKGAVAPGLKSGRRSARRLSEYGVQLREKQKVRRTYGVGEKQFRKYIQRAKKVRETTGEALLQILESRLDNLVYRLNLATSRPYARQLVTHGHILVDGQRVNIPSYLVKPGQIISLKDKSAKIPQIAEILSEKEQLPDWLERKAIVGRYNRLPSEKELESGIDLAAVIEYYSR